MNLRRLTISIKTITIFLFLLLVSCASIENDTKDRRSNSSLGEIVVTGVASTPSSTSADEPIREIIPIVGNLYRARNNRHYTIFLVTPEGIILGDPINTSFSEWLKEEFKVRFNSTVKYVLYSHHHFDHAAGGAVFADTADFVAHKNMLKALAAPLPSTMVFLDKNDDNIIQRDEAEGGTRADFDTIDANGDNQLTGNEFTVDIMPPNLTYSGSYTVYLGGMEVQMIHSGESHSNDGSILYFDKEAVAYGVDWINLGSLPGSLSGTPLEGWIESIDRMIALEPTRISPGHGDIGLLADLLAYKQYFVDLKVAVDTARSAGLSLDEFATNLTLEDYQHWERYDSRLAQNAAEAYELANR